MAIPTPKSTPASTRFEPPSPKAKVSPATTIATSDSPRAIVLVNACWRTLTAFSQGDWPAACANAADARIRDEQNATEADRSQRKTDFFRKTFFIDGEFLSDEASQTRNRIRRQTLAGLGWADSRRRGGGVTASRREAAPWSHTSTPNRRWQSPECCQQVPMGLGDLLLFRCALPRRRFQRELPSTITNGQKLALMSQKKMSRLPGTICSIRRILRRNSKRQRRALDAEVIRCLLKALQNPLDAPVDCPL